MDIFVGKVFLNGKCFSYVVYGLGGVRVSKNLTKTQQEKKKNKLVHLRKSNKNQKRLFSLRVAKIAMHTFTRMCSIIWMLFFFFSK